MRRAPIPFAPSLKLSHYHHHYGRVCVVILCGELQLGDGAPPASADRAAVIAAVVAAAKADMAADRKTPALKSLQVEDWPSEFTVHPPSVARRPASLLRKKCHHHTLGCSANLASGHSMNVCLGLGRETH